MSKAEEIIIKGATLVDAAGERRMDVLVRGETIVAVAESVEVPIGARIVDGANGYLLPAFVDLHTHLREPGGERSETVESGSRAAAIGGYRAVVAMPNTSPTIDSVEIVRHLHDLARNTLCEVALSGSITIGRLGEKLTPMADLAEFGICLFTDDGRGVQSDALMREALIVASRLGLTLGQHCENEEHAKGAPMHEGVWSSKLGLAGQPSSAEEVMVERDLELVRELGASMHFLHLSTIGAIDLVRRAKREGLSITAEATPHHLSLSDAEIASYNPVFKVNPPLRTAADVNGVRAGILDGTIDAIATDHAPHSPELKDEPFDCAPPGMIGLETAFAVAYTELVAKAHLRITDDPTLPALSMLDLVRLFTLSPARIARLDRHEHCGEIVVGARADLVVFDPTERWKVEESSTASRSHNTPFAQLDLVGRVRHTLYRGELVVTDADAQR